MSNKQKDLLLLRERAEEVFANMNEETDKRIRSTSELMHELQVHQIELELQNEELQTANKKLEISEEKYKSLFDFAPLIYLTLDEKGTILSANYTATKQFDIARDDLEGSRMAEFVDRGGREDFHLYLRQIVLNQEEASRELLFVRSDGSQFYGLAQSVKERASGKDPTIRISVTNINQRKFYEKHLQDMRELVQAILRAETVLEIVTVALGYLLNLTDCTPISMLIFESETDSVHIFSQSQNETEISHTIKSKSQIPELLLSNETRRIENPEGVASRENNIVLKVPIQHANEHLGCIWLQVSSGRMDDTTDIRMVQDISHQLSIAIHQAKLVEQVKQNALNLELQVIERTHKLHESEQQEHVQRIFAEALLEIGRSLNSTLNLDEVLDRILVNLERVLHYDCAEIVLLEDNIGRIAKWRGNASKHDVKDKNLEVNLSKVLPYKYILKTGKSFSTQDISKIADWRLPGLTSDTTSYIGVPICTDNLINGILNIYLSQSDLLGSQQIKYLDGFAEQAAIAINNSRQLRKEQQLAVLEERQRLGRDLHDSVNQTLFALTTMAESLVNRSNIAQDITTHILNLARGAQAEMRLLLLELYPKNIKNMALDDLLEQLATTFRGRHTRNIEAIIDETIPLLSVEIKLNLYRLTQEALANISKHTQSGDVTINLNQKDGHLVLLIADKGEGFDLHTIRDQGYGLSNMRERAISIGADLTIMSEIGKGTSILITLPLSEI